MWHLKLVKATQKGKKMNQGCDVTGDLTHRRPRTIQLCHPVTDKLIFTKSCNYLHIRKNPLLDDVFGNFWSPVNLETQEDKSSH